MAANFVTVDQIVINYSLGIDPDDYGSNVSDVMMRQYALLGAREIGFDVAQRIKSVKLTIDQSLGTAELPTDFVELTKIGTIGPDGLVYVWAVNDNMNLGIKPNNQDRQFLADLDSYVFNNYLYSSSLGRLYGLGGGQGAGQYRMNLVENRIEIAQDDNTDNVVIEYIADEAKSDCPLVPVVAEQAVKAYMYYNITQRKTFKLRAIKMKLWAAMLQQQGIPLKEYVAIDNRLNKVTRWNNLWSGNKPQQFSDKQMQKVCLIIDAGYAILEKYQAIANTQKSTGFTSNLNPLNYNKQKEIPWTSYKGNEGLYGYTGAFGPTKGEKAWKFPIGLAWESKPAIEGSRVYISSPGIRTKLYCLDLNTGKTIWKTQQEI